MIYIALGSFLLFLWWIFRLHWRFARGWFHCHWCGHPWPLHKRSLVSTGQRLDAVCPDCWNRFLWESELWKKVKR